VKYRTIVADPPWPYPEGFATQPRTAGKWEGPVTRAALPYPSMSIDAICALPVADLADKDARLFLWVTNKYLPDSFRVIREWGFRYRQMLTWDKRDSLSGSVAPNSEFLLVAARGTPGLLTRLSTAVVRASQTKEHSRKPDVFIDLIEQVSPPPRLELFARRHRLGWDVWGNESANTATLEAPA
jgi:N6-adenosine-specific RNA methylase IME4